MGKKNYSCESSDSCSLVSVTGISVNSCSESCSSTTKSSSSSSNPTSSCSSVSSCTSLSSCSSVPTSTSTSSCSSETSCSSEQTYSDNSTCKTSSTCDTSSTSNCSSSSSSKSKSCKCDSVSSSKCEKHCYKNCEKLCKKYSCAKEELLAISDIIVVLNFIKSKLVAVQPNIDLRHVEKYCIYENINWLECFVDTLFCVLRKNEAYKIIKVSDCKLKNDSCEEVVDNRTYLIKIKYCTKSGEQCKNLPLLFEWSQLTNNTAKSYKGVLDKVVKQIDNYIKGYQAASTVPFLC